MPQFWDRNQRGYEGPLTSDNPHDVVTLGGIKLPGICKVTAAPSIQLDRQKVADTDSTNWIRRGYLPGPIDIECMVWTPEQWEQLEFAISKLWKRPHKQAPVERGTSKKKSDTKAGAEEARASALTILHPNLALLGIRSVILEKVNLPEPGPVKGSRVVHFLCKEYVADPASPPKEGKKYAGARDATRVHESMGGAPKNTAASPSTTDAGPKLPGAKAGGSF